MIFRKSNTLLFLPVLLTVIFLVSLFGIFIVARQRSTLQVLDNIIIPGVKTWLGKYYKKSSAFLQLKNNDLFVNFQIETADKSRLNRLSTDLGLGEQWEKGIVINLDPQSKKFLSQFLPVKLDLTLSEDSINFTTPSGFVLNSSLSGEKYEYATGSGRLTFVKKSERDFSLEMSSPQDLLKDATGSGTLQLSNKLFSIFLILEKIDKINITVQNKNINGRVEYKIRD